MAARKKTPPQSDVAAVLEAKRATTEHPLVFISHDSRDADLAEAFGNLLTDASGGILKSFRSSDRKGNAGIEYGQEWYRAIMQKLDDANGCGSAPDCTKHQSSVDVPERVASELGNGARSMRGKRRSRFHPMMLEEML